MEHKDMIRNLKGCAKFYKDRGWFESRDAIIQAMDLLERQHQATVKQEVEDE